MLNANFVLQSFHISENFALHDGCVLLRRRREGIRCTGYARWDALMPFSDNLTTWFSVHLLSMVVFLTCMDTCDLQEGYQRTASCNRRRIFGKGLLFRL
jgi:hypothetical protein